MIRKVTTIMAALVAITAYCATPSRVITDSIVSPTLGVTRYYNVYLPTGYDTADNDTKYPVLYLLHGKGGNHTDWQKNGNVKAVADRLIRSGEAEKMVIIMPDAGEDYTPGRFGYFNYIVEPRWDYETFFFDELMPTVEAKYHIIGDKPNRAIAGLSMGGGGATSYGQKHPELFASVYAMSALMALPKERELNSDVNEYNRTVNANSCVKKVSEADTSTIDALKSVRWMADCGDDDFLFDKNIEWYQAMLSQGIPAELRVRDGGHDWEYWHTALYYCLPFASQTFKR